MSFQHVLEKYHYYSFSERDKGARFDRPGLSKKIFPSKITDNRAIAMTSAGSRSEFSASVTRHITDNHFSSDGT